DVEQREARHPIGVRRGPREAPRATEVVEGEVRALDAELAEEAVEVPRVPFHGVVEVGGPIGLAVTGHVRRDGAREVADERQEAGEVFARARIAVDEDDGLRRVARTRFAYQGSNSEDPHLSNRHGRHAEDTSRSGRAAG